MQYTPSKKSNLKWILLVGTLLFVAVYLFKSSILSLPFWNYISDDAKCNVPINIVVGDIDARFGIGVDTVKKQITEAAHSWEASAGQDLFMLDGGDETNYTVVVNLVYDDRQAQIISAQNSSEILQDRKADHAFLSREYQEIVAKYEHEVGVYEQQKNTYEARLREYNQKVDAWNKNGGEEEEYEALIEEKEELRMGENALKAKYDAVNALHASLNTLVAQLNNLNALLSEEINEHNIKYSSDESIEAGQFDGVNHIDIYAYEDLLQLRMTILHELGHSLGIGHVTQRESVMYPTQNEYQDKLKLTLSEEDISALKDVCKLEE